jgi:hypothetical protein
LKIDQQTEAHAGGAQVIQALSHMFISKTINAFQLDNKRVIHQNVGEITPNDEDLCKQQGTIPVT